MPNFTMPLKRLMGVSTLAMSLGIGVAPAQKVAIIDMQRAVLATSDGKKAAQALDTKFAPVKAEVDQMTNDLTAKREQLSKGGGAMSPSAIAAAQAEIDAMTTSLKRKTEDAQQDLRDEEDKLMGGIMPKLTQAINAYAAANQISVVVDISANPNNLIYGDVSVNITPAIIAAYEKAATPAEAAPASSAPATPPKTAAPSASTPKAPAAAAPKPPASTGAPKTVPAK